MPRVLFLGIDALDAELLDRFSEDLPNFSELRRSAVQLPVRSTFPPDSDTAWATIVTGMNPAEHGIVRFVDPLEKSYQIQNVGSRNEVLRGKTFWEIAGAAGLKAHAIFPHLCHPVWPTPGIMVARGSAVADVGATRPGVLQHYPDPDIMLGVRGFPDRSLAGMQRYLQQLERLARADAEFALRLMETEDWDLFFVYWSTIDAVGHFFWNYFDPDDPGYQHGHPLESAIARTYAVYDDILGQFLARIDDEVAVIVLSDHGHAGRPFKLVNVNEVLRSGGFLQARDLRSSPHLMALEKAKRLAVRTVSRYGLARLAGRALRARPSAIQAFTRPSTIDWEKTVAYASDMSGIKSYTYGGIMINRDALGERDYETVRSDIIDLIQRECVWPDGESLLEFIARREDIYTGPCITKYPDIVLEFKYGYGVGWSVNSPLITSAASHNLVPGSHRGSTGTSFIRGTSTASGFLDLADVCALILELLGIHFSAEKEHTSSARRQTT